MQRHALVLGWLVVAACDDGGAVGPDAGLAVTVVAPNGGETLIAAEPFELRWQLAGGAALPCDVDLIDADGRAIAVARGVTASTWTWQPPGVAAAAGFRLQLTARGADGATAVDSSDAAFTISPPATGVSLARDVQPIFTARCTTPFCHGAESQVALLNLAPGAAHAALVGIASASTACTAHLRVRPGQPDQSYLLWKLAGAGPCLAGVQMPKNATPLTAREVGLIRTWIAEGAKPN